jgi:DNA-binding transcriptional ArsR family regulator
VDKLRFSEIEIPGSLLNDARLRPCVRITYGKLASLASGTGFCAPDFRALDGTGSGSTARRHLRKLEEAGYIKRGGDGRGGKIVIIEPEGDGAEK